MRSRTAHQIYRPSDEEVARKEHRKQFRRKIAAAALAATIMQFWFAQLVVWGLSLYRIHSGIWGPWLIMEGLSSLGVAVVALGMMRAVKDIQDVASTR
jgi:hypothetical protein